MGRRRWFGSGRAEPAPEVRAAGEAFGVALAAVERAKASLVTAVRSGRSPGAPLAEALAGFEIGLADADGSMPDWRAPAVEAEWLECRDGLASARAGAETLRLAGEPPAIYEELIAALEGLMDPLEPFERAAAAFAALGVRL